MLLANSLPPMRTHTRALFSLYFISLLWSLTAPLGKWITLNALPLIFWRVLLCSLFLTFFIRKDIVTLYCHHKILLKKILYSGIIIALHWLTFYESVKLANISIATICLASSSFFICWVAYFWQRTPLHLPQIVQSILIIFSFIMIVNGSEGVSKIGLFIGLLSALLNALYFIINAQIMRSTDKAAIVLGIQLMTSCLILGSLMLLAHLLPLQDIFPHIQTFHLQLPHYPKDLIALLIFALLCTLLPFYLYLKAYQHIAPFTLSIILNLEPILSILIGIIVFKEYQDLSLGFYLGSALLLTLITLASKNALGEKEKLSS